MFNIIENIQGMYMSITSFTQFEAIASVSGSATNFNLVIVGLVIVIIILIIITVGSNKK